MRSLIKFMHAVSLAVLAYVISVIIAAAVEPGAQAAWADAKVACPMIYRPVMAMKAGRCVWYSNKCVAEADGAIVVPDGTCGFRLSATDSAKDRHDARTASEGLPLPWPFSWNRPVSPAVGVQPHRVRIMPVG